MAAGLSGQSDPGEILDLLQEVAVLLNLLQTATRRILGQSVCPHPVEVTANPPRYKLEDTPGEAVALSLLARSGWSVENSPLYELKVSNCPSFGLEINTLSLTQPREVITGPELASLMQEHLVAEGEVIYATAVFISW